nr:MAG TPA: hypothetical protein [Caudoviricetes sp.]
MSRSDRGFAFFPYRDYSIAYCKQYVNRFFEKNLKNFQLAHFYNIENCFLCKY